MFKKKIVNASLLEALTLHLLFGAISVVWAGISTIIRNHQRHESLLMVLSVGSLFNKLVMMSTIAHVSFTVRLVQKLSEFEIRRTEADIR